MFHFFSKTKKEEKSPTDMEELKRKVAAMEYANMSYCKEIKRLQKNIDALDAAKNYGADYLIQIAELPIQFLNTAFYTKRNDLANHCNATLSTYIGNSPISVTVAALCTGWEGTEGKIVLKLEDPYGFCCSQRMDISEKEAELYKGNILYVRLSQGIVSQSEKEVSTRLLIAIESCTPHGIPSAKGYRNRVIRMPDGMRYVSEAERSGYRLCEDAYGIPYKIHNPISEFAFQYAGISDEAEAIDALSSIQNYTRAAFQDEYLVKRVSPTEVRISGKSGILQQYYYKDNAIWLREEEAGSLGCWKYLQNREREKHLCQKKNWPSQILADEQLDFRAEKIIYGYEDIPDYMGLNDFFDYHDEQVKQKVFEFPPSFTYYNSCDMHRKALLEKYQKETLESPNVEIPAHILKEKTDSYSWHSKEFLENRLSKLTAGNKKIRERYKDFKYYYRVFLKYGYELHSKWYPWFCLWSNYGEWKHTFFDVRHRLMNGPISVYTANGNSSSMEERIKYKNLAEHAYYSKYGTLFPGDDTRYIEDDGFFYHDLKEDLIGTVVAYCDSAMSTGQGVNLHVKDPTGETTLSKLPVSAAAAQQAAGHIIFATFGYNYYHENPSLMELRILPYSLTEEMGEYDKDTVIYRVDGVRTYVGQQWVDKI